MEDNGGMYISPGLVKGVPLRASADNIDAKVDTYDGKDSFHGTAVSIYQRESKECSNVATPWQHHFTEQSKEAKPKPQDTVTPIVQCSITGSPKPPSPHYNTYSLGKDKQEVVRPIPWTWHGLYLST
jgi:hypothetical protein